MSRDTGGPAFPHITEDVRDGMNLRDYFAAKAMQGFVSNPDYSYMTSKKTAQWSYQMTDAMLKAREA